MKKAALKLQSSFFYGVADCFQTWNSEMHLQASVSLCDQHLSDFSRQKKCSPVFLQAALLSLITL